MSVGRQIKLIRSFKEQERKANVKNNNVVKEAFRRTTLTPEELAAEREEQRRLEAMLRKRKGDPTLFSLYGSQGSSGGPLLLVDGYNMLGFHPKLRALKAASLERARDRLEVMLSEYGGSVGISVALVWDAMGATERWSGVGYESIDRRGLTVIYSTAVEADTFIVRAAQKLLSSGAEYVIVATSDAEEAMLARSEGAFTVSGQQLMKDISAARTAAEAFRAGVNITNQGVVAAACRGALVRNVEVGDKDRAAELAAMMAGFATPREHEDAKRLGMNSFEYAKHARRLARRAGRTPEEWSSDSDSDGSHSEGDDGRR